MYRRHAWGGLGLAPSPYVRISGLWGSESDFERRAARGERHGRAERTRPFGLDPGRVELVRDVGQKNPLGPRATGVLASLLGGQVPPDTRALRAGKRGL